MKLCTLVLSSGQQIPTHSKAYKLLLPVATEWVNIGTMLEIQEHVLENIKREQKKDKGCLRVMLSKWLKQAKPYPTWSSLADAVSACDDGDEIVDKINKESMGFKFDV